MYTGAIEYHQQLRVFSAADVGTIECHLGCGVELDAVLTEHAGEILGREIGCAQTTVRHPQNSIKVGGARKSHRGE